MGKALTLPSWSTPSRPARTRATVLADALAAWRLIKAKTARLGLHGGRFGVMGYSAGGHLAARLTSYLSAAEQPDDVMLIYPAYLQETNSGTRICREAAAGPDRAALRIDCRQ